MNTRRCIGVSIGWLLTMLLLPLAAPADDDPGVSVMNQEIDYILDTVETSDCVFIRNGKEHDAESARSHLELKRRRGKKYFDSADEFVERLASSSSWSGKPYFIRCGDDEQQAKDWFTKALQDYRAAR